jgi:hypothetical protein
MALIWHSKHHPLPVIMQNHDGQKFKDYELGTIKIRWHIMKDTECKSSGTAV